MNLPDATALAKIRAELRQIHESCHAIERALEVTADDGSYAQQLLDMTFRDFVKTRLGTDKRIRGIPLFHSILGHCVNDSPMTRNVSSFTGFTNIGDIPVGILVRISDCDILRIPGVAGKGLSVLRTVLKEHGILA